MLLLHRRGLDLHLNLRPRVLRPSKTMLCITSIRPSETNPTSWQAASRPWCLAMCRHAELTICVCTDSSVRHVPARVDEQSPRAHAGHELAIYHAAGAGRQRQQHHDHIRGWQYRVQL